MVARLLFHTESPHVQLLGVQTANQQAGPAPSPLRGIWSPLWCIPALTSWFTGTEGWREQNTLQCKETVFSVFWCLMVSHSALEIHSSVADQGNMSFSFLLLLLLLLILFLLVFGQMLQSQRNLFSLKLPQSLKSHFKVTPGWSQNQ